MKDENNNLKGSEIDSGTDEWINPIGGLGDTLMLSGVLKLVHDKFPEKRYNLIRRTEYTNFLREHPIIARVGFPPRGARIISTTYWQDEHYGQEGNRAFQILARMFGLETPVEEKLFLTGEPDDIFLKNNIIPWREKNVIIAPSSDSPRKVMHPMAWHHLVERLYVDGIFVMQVGRPNEMHIKNTYSLLGATNPRQIISLLGKANVIITSDNFIMHAAHLVQKPAVVLWGPTKPEFYGYTGHVHLRSQKICALQSECIGPKVPQNYPTPCPLGLEHCINQIPVEEIYKAVKKLL